MSTIVLGLILLVALLGHAPAAQASACVAGDAASYEALGAGGCQIGDKTFSNFNFASTTVLDANVLVTPGQGLIVPDDIGFSLGISGLVAVGKNSSRDLLLTYTVRVDDPDDFLISDAHLTFTGGAEGDTGLAVVDETLCPLLQSCLNTILSVFDAPLSTQTQDDLVFGGVAVLRVTKDIEVFSDHNSDFAAISGVEQTFTQVGVGQQCAPGTCEVVPEPSTMLLWGTGLAGLGAILRRRR